MAATGIALLAGIALAVTGVYRVFLEGRGHFGNGLGPHQTAGGLTGSKRNLSGNLTGQVRRCPKNYG